MGNVKKERRKKGSVHLQGAGLRSMLMLLGVNGRQVLLIWQETVEVKF